MITGGAYRGSTTQRIRWIANAIDRFMARTPGIVFVAIEDHAFAATGRGKSQLAELHGVVKDRILGHNVPFGVYSSMTLKKTATGDGHADKAMMIQAAKREGFQACFNDDEADAFWAARHFIHEVEPF